LSWRAVFLVNLPFGLLAMALTRSHVPAPAPRPGSRIDVPAQLAGMVALAALTAGLNEGGSLGWGAPPVLGCLGTAVAGAACVAVAIRRHRGRPGPAPARRRALVGGSSVGLLLNLGFYGLLFLATLYFQRLRGYGPLEAGLALLPMFVVMTASSFVSGRMSARTGPRSPMVVGLLVGSVGLAGWLAAGTHTGYVWLVAPMALAGAGTSFAMPAATTAVMESAPHGRAGSAAASLNAARQLGSALGVALFGSLSARQLLPGLHTSALLAAMAFVVAAVVAAWTAPSGS
jgi:DHA2 family methylenomycin A resistance protein-like MFS transporter